jgi:hypothetical protein
MSYRTLPRIEATLLDRFTGPILTCAIRATLVEYLHVSVKAYDEKFE